ncbi:hypothetical protein P9B03_18675 [Metasolibacillus meyeri]|uniref:Uncharacterized protein n=1 Tax=Metasolibacillus meyeri TaxID=1071052 RepID=A0AAW9NVZ3_9BACL|nr:hypothetical protein [Metasolibacillus meyeri]MEC1180493.1 hypothetical protein [Metasolibacillus meyeri]
MKLYSIYEFPESLYILSKILVNIEKMQPVHNLEAENILEKLLGKRPSRIKITIRNLKSLEIITGKNSIKLSHETQVYMDTNSDLSELLLLLIYNDENLFQQCKDICNIENFDVINNINLIYILWSRGYTEENISTAKEKIYALKRLINCCYHNKSKENNIFTEYENYLNFIEDLQNEYLSMAPIGEVMVINNIRRVMEVNKGYTFNKFNRFLNRLFNDPIYSKFVAFTTVNNIFAHKGYFSIKDKDYYYIKLLKRIIYKNTLF